MLSAWLYQHIVNFLLFTLLVLVVLELYGEYNAVLYDHPMTSL